MVFEPRSKDGTQMTRMRRIIAGSFESVDKKKVCQKNRHGLHGLTRIYISFYTRTVIIYPCNPRNPCLKIQMASF